jgi:hypothetical protein
MLEIHTFSKPTVYQCMEADGHTLMQHPWRTWEAQTIIRWHAHTHAHIQINV